MTAPRAREKFQVQQGAHPVRGVRNADPEMLSDVARGRGLRMTLSDESQRGVQFRRAAPVDLAAMRAAETGNAHDANTPRGPRLSPVLTTSALSGPSQSHV